MCLFSFLSKTDGKEGKRKKLNRERKKQREKWHRDIILKDCDDEDRFF